MFKKAEVKKEVKEKRVAAKDNKKGRRVISIPVDKDGKLYGWGGLLAEGLIIDRGYRQRIPLLLIEGIPFVTHRKKIRAF